MFSHSLPLCSQLWCCSFYSIACILYFVFALLPSPPSLSRALHIYSITFAIRDWTERMDTYTMIKWYKKSNKPKLHCYYREKNNNNNWKIETDTKAEWRETETSFFNLLLLSLRWGRFCCEQNGIKKRNETNFEPETKSSAKSRVVRKPTSTYTHIHMHTYQTNNPTIEWK